MFCHQIGKIMLSLLVLCFVYSCETEKSRELRKSPEITHALSALARHLDQEDVSQYFELRTIEDMGDLGEEGYRIQSRSGEDKIMVEGTNDHAIANGLYTLLRRIMTDDIREPFSHDLAIEETPYFGFRSMQVAPYSFGFAHDWKILSVDQWSFNQWKPYLEFLRLLNANVVNVYPVRTYTPLVPESFENKARYEVWLQVLHYAHELGMKFVYTLTHNQVPDEVWWKNPELRTQYPTLWLGNTLCYSRARDKILELQRYTYETFKDADYFGYMYTDGGAECYCDLCSEDQAQVMIRSFEDAKRMLSEVGSHAQIIFWTWMVDNWYQKFGEYARPGYLEQFPANKDPLSTLIDYLPRSVPVHDIAATSLFSDEKSPTLKRAKKEGFQTVINFFWHMNPEFPISLFPRPDFGFTIGQARYSKEIGIEGVEGYRLSPYSRLLNDFVFLRLASDPDLTRQQLLEELAGFLTDGREQRETVIQAVDALDRFYQEQRHEDIVQASDGLNKAADQGDSWQLRYTADMTSLMPGLHQLAMNDLDKEEAARIRQALHEETKKRYLLQGFSTQIPWQPAAKSIFDAWTTIWAPYFKPEKINPFRD